jgi:monoamine oxidase
MVTDTYGHYFYHATKNQPGKKGVLISYTIGDKADVISRQNEEFKTGIIQESLRPAFGDIKDKMVNQVNYYWGIDEYSKGAYALYGKGQWFAIMPVLKKKFLSTYFAGEHLADWQGFMEGAIVTGEEAADEIAG